LLTIINRPSHQNREEVNRLSLKYLKEAVAENDSEKLIRYIRLHLGDGNEKAGRKEIDKAWIEALKLLLDVPATDRQFIFSVLSNQSPATLVARSAVRSQNHVHSRCYQPRW